MTDQPLGPGRRAPAFTISLVANLATISCSVVWVVVTWRPDGGWPNLARTVLAAGLVALASRALIRMWRDRHRSRAEENAGRLLRDRIQRLDPAYVYENRDSRTRYTLDTWKTRFGRFDSLAVSDLDHEYAVEEKVDRDGRAVRTVRVYEIGPISVSATSDVLAYRADKHGYTLMDVDQPFRHRLRNTIRSQRWAAKRGLLVVPEAEIRSLIEDLDGAEGLRGRDDADPDDQDA